MSDAGLAAVSLPYIERLLEVLEAGRLRTPLDESDLRAEGFGAILTSLSWMGSLDAPACIAVLRAVIAERTSHGRPSLELVWTGPEAKVSGARDTSVVVRELFLRSRQSAIVGGYVFREARDIFAPLHEVMRAFGVCADIFMHVEPGRDGRSAEETIDHAMASFLARNWPPAPPYPNLYLDPRTAVPNSGCSLHAKCVVVDGRWSFVGSANFTDRGHSRNIEAGVLIDDVAFAAALAAQWRGLISAGLVVRATNLR